MIATLTSIETSSDAKASDSFSCATPMPRLNIVASDENVQHMATAVQSPNIAESALSEVAKLATTIKEIRAMNRKIHGDLYVFDQAGFDHRQGKLSVEWQTYMTVRCSTFSCLTFDSPVTVSYRTSKRLLTSVAAMRLLRLRLLKVNFPTIYAIFSRPNVALYGT